MSENEDQVNAGMVTMNGSLVERYAVDKRTGAWRRELERFRIDRNRSGLFSLPAAEPRVRAKGGTRQGGPRRRGLRAIPIDLESR